MREITGALANTLQSNVTTLCRLVDVQASNGQTFYFTDHDRDVVYAGNTYSAQFGCSVSQVRSTLGADAESVTATVLMDPSAITSALVEGGALDNALLRVLLVDFTNSAVATVFFVGNVTALDFSDGLSVAMSATPALSQDRTLAGDVYSSNCRADLGDAKCKAHLGSATGAVAAVDNLQVIETTIAASDDDYAWGTLVFTSGANDGFSFEIATNAAGKITLRGILPQPPAVGDTVTVYQGCDKTPTMCQQKYNNIANFRGEPFAVAPWVVTSEAKDDGSTDYVDTTPPAKVYRTLYAYVGIKGFYETLQRYEINARSFDNPAHPDNPEFGPVRDDWGICNYNADGTPNEASKDTIGTDDYNYIGIASDIQVNVMRGSTPYPDCTGWIWRRPLTALEAQAVRKKYPNA